MPYSRRSLCVTAVNLVARVRPDKQAQQIMPGIVSIDSVYYVTCSSNAKNTPLQSREEAVSMKLKQRRILVIITSAIALYNVTAIAFGVNGQRSFVRKDDNYSFPVDDDDFSTNTTWYYRGDDNMYTTSTSFNANEEVSDTATSQSSEREIAP